MAAASKKTAKGREPVFGPRIHSVEPYFWSGKGTDEPIVVLGKGFESCSLLSFEGSVKVTVSDQRVWSDEAIYATVTYANGPVSVGETAVVTNVYPEASMVDKYLCVIIDENL